MQPKLKYIVFAVLGIAIIAAVVFIQRSIVLDTIGEVIVKNDSTNALRVNLDFSLEKPAEVRIKYWLDVPDSKVYYSETSKAGTTHSITVVNLLADKHYKFQIVENGGRFAGASSVMMFSTTKMPKAMMRIRWIEKPKQPFEGYILAQRAKLKAEEGYMYLLNVNGDPVWYNKVVGLPKLSCWTERNTMLVLSGDPKQERSAGNHIFEYDIYGNELINLDLKQIANPMEAHHEIRYTPDGSLLTLTYDRKKVDVMSPKGETIHEIKGDAIIRINKQGDILWKWSVFDVLDPLNSPYPYDSLGEWGHANTVSIDRDGNYLISFRDWSEIWKVNSKDGSLIWKLGEHGDFKLPDNFKFSGQHSIHINPRGEYMMFDNGVKNKRSRVLAFTLDEKSKTVNVTLNILLPESYYSQKRGSAYFLDENRILVCAAEASTIAIVDVNGNILGRAHTGLPDYYRAVYVPQLYPINPPH